MVPTELWNAKIQQTLCHALVQTLRLMQNVKQNGGILETTELVADIFKSLAQGVVQSNASRKEKLKKKIYILTGQSVTRQLLLPHLLEINFKRKLRKTCMEIKPILLRGNIFCRNGEVGKATTIAAAAQTAMRPTALTTEQLQRTQSANSRKPDKERKIRKNAITISSSLNISVEKTIENFQEGKSADRISVSERSL